MHVSLSHLLFITLILLSGGVRAQDTLLVSDSDLTNGNYHWTADHVYYLQDLVFLERGGELTIDPGTVIIGSSAPFRTGQTGVGLVITRGAKIFANGTAAAPIIFTTDRDNLEDPTDLDKWGGGLWDGLTILGEARVSLSEQSTRFESGPIEERFAFGGTNDNDNSGVLRYVSVRHAGAVNVVFLQGAVSLLGVGSGTQIDHVETFSSGSSGVQVVGGTVNLKHLVAAYSVGQAFDLRHGYRGKGQFWLGVGTREFLLRVFENTARDSSYYLKGEPDLANITLVRDSVTTFWFPQTNYPGFGVRWWGAVGGKLRNSLVLHTGSQDLWVHNSTNYENDAWAFLLDGSLRFENNLLLATSNLPGWADNVGIFPRPRQDLVNQRLIDSLSRYNQLSLDRQVRHWDYVDNLRFNPLLKYGSQAENGGIPLTDPFFTPVNYQGAFGSSKPWHQWTFLGTDLDDFQIISGTVRQGTADCDPAIWPAAEVLVALETDGVTRYATTDSSGNFQAFVPMGTTEISAYAPSSSWSACAPVTVHLAEAEDANVELTLAASENCPRPRVSIGAPFLAPGFPTTYYVAFDNLGAATARDAEISVLLPAQFVVAATSLPIARQSGDTLFFLVGDLLPVAGARTIEISGSVDISSLSGTEACAEAYIRISNACPTDGSALLRVTGTCTDQDSLRFTVRNFGDPAIAVPYVVIEDEVMFRSGDLNIGSNQAQEFLYAAPGASTFHFSTLANPTSDNPHFTAATLSCANNPRLGRRYFPATDLQLDFALDCQNILDVLSDSARLACTPLGLTREAIVPPASTLRYRISFDKPAGINALTVIDTLPPALEIASFQMGASSHELNWNLKEEGTLEVNFPDLRTERISGFFDFSVQIAANTEEGTAIRNFADLYFGASAPQRTNLNIRQIGTLPAATTATAGPHAEQTTLLLYPQPAGDFLFVEPADESVLHGTFTLYGSDGKRLQWGQISTPRHTLSLANLPGGSYVYVFQSSRAGTTLSHRFIRH